MSGYGFGIVQTLIVDIEPDAQVKRAMNEINAGKMRLYNMHFFYTLFYIKPRVGPVGSFGFTVYAYCILFARE